VRQAVVVERRLALPRLNLDSGPAAHTRSKAPHIVPITQLGEMPTARIPINEKIQCAVDHGSQLQPWRYYVRASGEVDREPVRLPRLRGPYPAEERDLVLIDAMH
jgi:hypothetical protein